MGQEQSRPAEALVFGLWLRTLRKDKLNISLGKLAENLKVHPSTISAWETGQYPPSGKKLIELGNILATAGHRECLELWGKAGIDAAKLSAVWQSPRPLPVGMVRVPLIQAGRGDPAQIDAPKLTWDLPPYVVPNRASTLCACLTGGLFPFGAGDVFAVDNSASADLWELCGSLVVVHFSRYPARLEVELSQRAAQQMLKRATRVDRPLEKQGAAIRRGIEEQYGGLSAAERAGRDDAQGAFESELAKRWTPDKHGTIGLEHIQAGWLRLQLADDPDFAIFDDQTNWLAPESPWRLVLQGASIKGVGGGLAVPLTGWEASLNWRDHPPIRLQANRILGRAIAWMAAVSLESAGSLDRRAAAITRPKGKIPKGARRTN